MTERIVVDMKVAEGALVRVLGLIERRGYQVHGIGMRRHECGEMASLVLDVKAHDAGRELTTLDLQLRRLHEVSNVTHAITSAQVH